MNIRNAEKKQACDIARLIMTAMTDECCLHFVGRGQTLDDYYRTMTRLVERDDTQYSYRNTIVATDNNGTVTGICVSYDGALLRQLRAPFIEAAKTDFGRDFSGMEDETQAGELYIDSLAVKPEHRGQGIASALLRATIEKARQMKLPATGLLVDCGNPNAERLYRSLGFEYINDATWGGHPMKHMQVRF